MSDMLALENAFEALETKGILARHNYYCCGGCGGYALFQEYEKIPNRDEIIGGVYYHEQSAEHALNGRGLTLYYDALPSGDFGERQRVIGETIVAELVAQGLEVAWDGSPSSAIDLPRFKVTLDEIPEGTESSLHTTYGAKDEDDDDDDDWKW